MAGDDQPGKKVVATALEEGEIPEHEHEEENQHPPPSPTAAVVVTTSAPPPVKNFKAINVVMVGSSSTTAGGVAPPAPPPPAPQAQPPVAPGQVSCPLCNRVFDSYPAMFGHQRVHKERTYRGAYPPPTFNREGSPPPTAEETEEAARVAAQMLLDMSKGHWEKTAAEQRDTSSSSARGGVCVDLNIPLASDDETEEEEKAKEGHKVPNLDLNKSPPEDEE